MTSFFRYSIHKSALVLPVASPVFPHLRCSLFFAFYFDSRFGSFKERVPFSASLIEVKYVSFVPRASSTELVEFFFLIFCEPFLSLSIKPLQIDYPTPIGRELVSGLRDRDFTCLVGFRFLASPDPFHKLVWCTQMGEGKPKENDLLCEIIHSSLSVGRLGLIKRFAVCTTQKSSSLIVYRAQPRRVKNNPSDLPIKRSRLQQLARTSRPHNLGECRQDELLFYATNC